MAWPLAEAKNRLSELIGLASSEGVQEIKRRGEKFFVLAEKNYLTLKNQQVDFKQFLLTMTPDMSDLDISRDNSAMRTVEL